MKTETLMKRVCAMLALLAAIAFAAPTAWGADAAGPLVQTAPLLLAQAAQPFAQLARTP